MEFGRLTVPELAGIDFTLPEEPARNSKVLPGKPANGKIYLGMPKWGRTEWAGTLYPPKTKEKDFLSHYVNFFNTVELNATHYKIYGSGGIAKWADMARDRDFRFCPKMYKGITHFRQLTGKEFPLNEFMRGVETFGEHLGPIFIQLSEHFGGGRKKELHTFLESLPDKFLFFLEMRHPDLLNNEELFTYLQSKDFGAVITDTAGRRDCAHMRLTIPKTMIRFIANDHPSDLTRIQEWAERLRFWLDSGIEEIYFFVHAADEGTGLNFVREVIDTFNDVCKTKIQRLPATN